MIGAAWITYIYTRKFFGYPFPPDLSEEEIQVTEPDLEELLDGWIKKLENETAHSLKRKLGNRSGKGTTVNQQRTTTSASPVIHYDVVPEVRHHENSLPRLPSSHFYTENSERAMQNRMEHFAHSCNVVFEPAFESSPRSSSETIPMEECLSTIMYPSERSSSANLLEQLESLRRSLSRMLPISHWQQVSNLNLQDSYSPSDT
ncbi:uncharacterized protein LOC115074517 [Rhinatrema bivittatum]|uniref:uncharacterized protein LOC115074517 n=1 Tax=Rhinatrema bivittatum TaxID=194408 RepID=UPI00112A5A74|nr:uncharacterized protein LOC115074517 [Rhinatrema bivittatum]